MLTRYADWDYRLLLGLVGDRAARWPPVCNDLHALARAAGLTPPRNPEAAVTGPSAWQALMDNPTFDPSSKAYGPRGVLGDCLRPRPRHRRQATHADRRLSSTPDQKTYGTPTARSARRDEQPGPVPRAHAVPLSGGAPGDVREIGVDSGGLVHTWYIDGWVSVGTPTDLGLLSPTDQALPKASLPSGYGTAKMFGVGKNALTYDQIHRHSLRRLSVATGLRRP